MHNACTHTETHTETHTACKGNNNMFDMVKLKGMLFALRFMLSKKIKLDSLIFVCTLCHAH